MREVGCVEGATHHASSVAGSFWGLLKAYDTQNDDLVAARAADGREGIAIEIEIPLNHPRVSPGATI